MDAPHRRIHLILKIALGVTVVALIILCVLLTQQYQRIQRLSYIAAHRQSLLRSLRGSGPLSPANASSTQAWMTFDYIDRVFALPPQYLQSTLAISDSRYPRLTVMEYAKDTGLTQAAALVRVQDAVRAYSATSTSSVDASPASSSSPAAVQ